MSPRWLAALLLMAAAAQYGWNIAAQPALWGYDEGAHGAHALEILETGSLPDPLRGWVTFHPPVYYLLAAGTWGVVEALGPRAVLCALRVFSALGILAAGLVVYALIRRIGGSESVATVALGVTLFVPVAQLSATMAGNEALAAGFASLALGCVVLLQADPGQRRVALLAGLFAGLAFATKFSGLWAAAACAVPFARRDLDARGRRSLVACFAVLSIVAGPVYLRNAVKTGSPLPFTRTQHEVMLRQEARLTGGPRHWSDYVSVPLRCGQYPYVNVIVEGGLLAGINPDMQSIPCVAYAGFWFDPFGLRATRSDPNEGLDWGYALMLAGIVPTLLVLFGFGACVVRALRTRGRSPEAPLVAVVALALPGFVAFTWLVPSLSAAKASYLLPLLVPAGVFFANGCMQLPEGARRFALVWSAGAAGLAAWVFTTGIVFAPTDAQASKGFWMAMGRQLPDPWIVEAAQRLVE